MVAAVAVTAGAAMVAGTPAAYWAVGMAMVVVVAAMPEGPMEVAVDREASAVSPASLAVAAAAAEGWSRRGSRGTPESHT